MKIALSVQHALRYHICSPLDDLFTIYDKNDKDEQGRNLLTLYFLYRPLTQQNAQNIEQFIQRNYLLEPQKLKPYHIQTFLNVLLELDTFELQTYFKTAIVSQKDNIYPNLAAWLLSIGGANGLTYLKKFHIKGNVYETPNYNFLKEFFLRPYTQEFATVAQLENYLKKTQKFFMSIQPSHPLWQSLLATGEIQRPQIKNQIIDNFMVNSQPRAELQSIASFISQLNFESQGQKLLLQFLQQLPIEIDKHLTKTVLEQKNSSHQTALKKIHKI